MMRNQATEKRLNVWLVWQHEKEEHHLDRLSQKGLHLEKPGFFRAQFRRNDVARFVYRLDYRPQLKPRHEFDDYLTIFEDAGWEYKGGLKGWHYFRRPWSEHPVDMYTDRASLHMFYQRIQKMIGVVILLELMAVVYEATVTLLLPTPVWHWAWPIWIIWASLLAMLGYGYHDIGKKVRASK